MATRFVPRTRNMPNVETFFRSPRCGEIGPEEVVRRRACWARSGHEITDDRRSWHHDQLFRVYWRSTPDGGPQDFDVTARIGGMA